MNTHTGPNVGVVVQVQIYIDDIFPKIFGGRSSGTTKELKLAPATRNKGTLMKITSSIIILTLLLLTGHLACAHAFLDHALPRVGSASPHSPPEVKIWFTEELEGAFSRIQVFNTTGAEVDRKDSRVDSSQKAVMTVSLPPLAPGDYKVRWSAVATDTHHTMGTFQFTVKGP